MSISAGGWYVGMVISVQMSAGVNGHGQMKGWVHRARLQMDASGEGGLCLSLISVTVDCIDNPGCRASVSWQKYTPSKEEPKLVMVSVALVSVVPLVVLISSDDLPTLLENSFIPQPFDIRSTLYHAMFILFMSAPLAVQVSWTVPPSWGVIQPVLLVLNCIPLCTASAQVLCTMNVPIWSNATTSRVLKEFFISTILLCLYLLYLLCLLICCSLGTGNDSGCVGSEDPFMCEGCYFMRDCPLRSLNP